MDATKLVLRNMVFYGYHGAYAAEQEMGQRIEVDLEVTADFSKAAATDDLDEAVNYVDLYALVKNVVEEGENKLLEGIARQIIDCIMKNYELDRVMVRVRKPQPPIGGLADAVEFEAVKSRK
jgi:dihydroneopterin aldolase